MWTEERAPLIAGLEGRHDHRSIMWTEERERAPIIAGLEGRTQKYHVDRGEGGAPIIAGLEGNYNHRRRMSLQLVWKKLTVVRARWYHHGSFVVLKTDGTPQESIQILQSETHPMTASLVPSSSMPPRKFSVPDSLRLILVQS